LIEIHPFEIVPTETTTADTSAARTRSVVACPIIEAAGLCEIASASRNRIRKWR